MFFSSSVARSPSTLELAFYAIEFSLKSRQLCRHITKLYSRFLKASSRFEVPLQGRHAQAFALAQPCPTGLEGSLSLPLEIPHAPWTRWTRSIFFALRARGPNTLRQVHGRSVGKIWRQLYSFMRLVFYHCTFYHLIALLIAYPLNPQ